ncbi:hypothetical protein [Pseudomonas sp. SDI]|uniref:hypothetical protein n=1 Tax=Pseudomonas sp. SDI TaxID=2170734 RepID=UPI002114A5B9|nr:hypothetical protein [Pseudomonas sp. SDI]
MSTSVRKQAFPHALKSVPLEHNVPIEVVQAQSIDWGITIDAYLASAARAGQRYAATVFSDLSGASDNGMTVATPPLEFVEERAGFKLMRSVGGADHFVITSELSV